MNKQSAAHEKVSIREIAKEANVSIATVSRVINHNGPVSEKTEKRVREAIEKNHFIPSLAARGMRSHKLPVIAFLVENTKNEYFSDLASHLQQFFYERGYFLLICTTNYEEKNERAVIDMLLAQQISGIIIISRDIAPDNIPDEIPTVYIDCRMPASRIRNAVCIESDNKNGGYLATMELIEKGCRHIAVFTAPDEAYTARNRTEGYFSALLEAGIPIDLRYVFRFEHFDYSNGAMLTKKLLDSGIECDGIFSICDYILQGVMDTLMTNHISVPDRMKVIGFDDIYLASCGLKKLSTIHQSARSTAQKAAEVIFKMIDNVDSENGHIIMPVYLVRRETT